MKGWKQVRAAAGGGVAVVAVWAVVALAAPAQPRTAELRFIGPEAAPPEPEKLPKLDDFTDPNIEPAQFRQPAPGGPGSPPRPGYNVPDPAHPVVRIQVRVPADAVPDDDLKYVITVQNVSSADAHSVTVRVPRPAEAEAVVRAEPQPDPAQTNPQQLVWVVGTLKGGRSATIELTLKPKPNVRELKTLAYVRFEHGQAVTTKIGKPTVKVAKVAPKQTVRDEPYSVRITLENTGRVAAQNVRVVENLPVAAEVEPLTPGAKKLAAPQGQQWEWELARLLPGERKVIEYRVTPREAKDVFTLTSVAGQRLIPDKPAEARTQVLVPGLKVELAGPTGVLNPGEAAKFEIVVRNTGTLPSTNVRVVGTIPSDCRPTQKTEGGQIYRDSVVWTVPRLEAGEAQSFRYSIKANTTGRRVIVASASDARGTKHSQELATVFSGTAALVWETKFDPQTVRVGRQGVFTVRVRNVGGEVARNVRLQLDVPDNVSVVETTPKVRVDGTNVAFGTDSIPGYGELTYTITFEGKKSDQAWFKVQMSADCLGDRPMRTEKMVEVIGGPK